MVKIKLGAIITDASGNLGGSVIQNGTSGFILRNKPNPIDPRTPNQLFIRSINKQMQEGWRALTDIQRLIWGSYAKTKPVYNKKGDKHPLSGHSLWMKYQFWYVYYGLPFLVNPADYKLYALASQTFAIYNAMFTKPNSTRLLLINDLVEGLISDGIWLKLDQLLVMACHTNTNGEAQINWINPGTFDCTLVNNPSFEIDRGFTGNGITQYINNQYNPFSDAVNYTLNNGFICIYIRDDIYRNAIDFGSWDSFSGIQISPIWAGDIFRIRLNGVNAATGFNTVSTGFFFSNRIDSTYIEGYRNKIKLIDTLNNSTSIPDLNLWSLGRNFSGSPNYLSNKQCSLNAVGSGLSQTNVNNFTDRVETYMDAIGAGVI